MDYFTDKEPRDLRSRLYIVTALVLFTFFIFTAYLWYLQVMRSEHYSTLSKTNRIRLQSIAAPRGLIFDRNGTRLAENHPSFKLSIIPEDISDMAKTKELLTKLIDIDEAAFDKALGKAKKRARFRPVKIKEDLSWEEMERVSTFAYELPGVKLEVKPKRTYPQKAVAAHLLGYTGEISERALQKRILSGDKSYKSGDETGKYGLESFNEEWLRGSDGGRQVEVDAVGRELKVKKTIPPYPGNNITLTIDLTTQLAAWDAMIGKAGAVIALDPRNGKILAMVSAPAFDPNLFSGGISANDWSEIINNPLNVLTNRAIQGQYPPASTFKVITAAAVLEEKIVTPEEKILSGPSFSFKGRAYRDWKAAGHGEINIHSAIVESSDTFFYQVGLKLGVDRIALYAKDFGLGDKTGIGLNNEKPGLVPNSEWKQKALNDRWYTGETISVSVGQGYTLATPIQLLSAYAAIANNGTLYVPKLIERVTTPEGEVIHEFEAEEKNRLTISEENLTIIKEALRGVVTEEKGTARWLNRNDFEIAGKTGTAQVIRMKEREKDITKQKYKFRDHALFVGFAPYSAPEIVVVVIVEHGGFGSSAAAPVALKVIRSYMTERAKEKALEASIKPMESSGESTLQSLEGAI